MKQHQRLHFSACGQIEAFIQTHASLYTGEHPSPALFVRGICSCPQHSTPCEHAICYLQGWEQGTALASLAANSGDLLLYQLIGTIGGWTTRRPPRHDRSITAERDAFEAHLQGETLRAFIRGWKSLCPPHHKPGV